MMIKLFELHFWVVVIFLSVNIPKEDLSSLLMASHPQDYSIVFVQKNMMMMNEG